jgi:hypothetical protein
MNMPRPTEAQMNAAVNYTGIAGMVTIAAAAIATVWNHRQQMKAKSTAAQILSMAETIPAGAKNVTPTTPAAN